MGSYKIKIKKGDKFKNVYSNEIYIIAGRYCGDYILSPLKPNDEVCLIYTIDEITDFVKYNEFTRED